MSSEESDLLSRAWHARNKLYKDLFGTPLYTLPKGNVLPMPPEPELRRSTQNNDGGDDMVVWNSGFTSGLTPQRVTVMAYPPGEQRPYWLYVTSGLSNPWFQEQPDEVSGFGCELILKAKRDARWAVKFLRRLAFYILSYSGTLSPGVILNMPTSVNGSAESALNNAFVWYADEAPECWYQLPSGGFGLFCTVGITEDECQFAESAGEYACWSIQEVLRKTGIGQVTDPARGSVMNNDDIKGILNSVRNYADNFRLT